MTPKERWLAALRMNPVDRLPFWPKLGGGYGEAQAAPFRDMEIDAIHDWVGSDKHAWAGNGVVERRSRTSSEVTKKDGVMRTVYKTPHGETELVCTYDGPSRSWHPMKFPVSNLGDIELMTEFFEDVTVEIDRAAMAQTKEQVERSGQDAMAATNIGESPLMYWVEWMAGIENAHFLLADHESKVEALFDAMHRVLVRKTELICESSPADAIYLTENTSTTLISPEQYERYCVRHVGEYARIARDADRNLILHMCGHLKALLPRLAGIPARAFEAFTSPTLGNTTLADGRSGCPDKCLIGGTNAMLWLKPAKEIIAKLEEDLAALPHHRGIVVTSAGVMPPICRPETIRTVCEWVKAYPARMN